MNIQKHGVNMNNRPANNDNNKSQESLLSTEGSSRKNYFIFQWWQSCLPEYKRMRRTRVGTNIVLLFSQKLWNTAAHLRKGNVRVYFSERRYRPIHCWLLLCEECSCLLNPRFDFNGALEAFYDNDMLQLLSTWEA